MKPSVKNLRYLAALAPLALGVVLSGCGGLLGSVEGTGPAATVPPPQVVVPTANPPVAIAVARTFTVTGQALGRGRVFAATTARLVFITNAGQRVVVDTQTPVPATGYTLTANLDNFPTVDFSRGLWTVEVEGADNGTQQAFAAPLLPPTTAGATVSGVNANGATTVAVALLNDLVDDPGFILTSGFQTAINNAVAVGQTLAPSLSATAFNAASATAVLSTVEAALPPLVNALVSQIRITQDGSAVPPIFPLTRTGSVIFEAQALNASGQSVAIPIEFSLSPTGGGSILNATAFDGDSLWVQAVNVGTVTVTARVAGNTVSTSFSIQVQPLVHPGHTQGSGIGG